MTTGRMFEKSSQTTLRYRLNLEVNLLESKNQFNLHLHVGYGIPDIGESKEFYFISSRNIDTDGELQSFASIFDTIEEIITNKLKEGHFPVDKLNLKLTSEMNNPIVLQKSEISVTEALKDFELIKSNVLSIIEKFILPKQKCIIL